MNPSPPSPTRRSLVMTLLSSGLLAAAGSPAFGQAWPQSPIRLVVPWAPGGTTDMIARIIAQPLGQALGTTVVVDNKPGAGGNIGTSQAVKDKPDGYTLILVTSTTQAINPHLYQKPGFDVARDFTPIINIGSVPNVLVVNPNSPYRTVRELVSAARAAPGKLTYGSGGNGSSQHIAGEMFKRAAGIDVVHVPYKGGGPALADLMAGHIDMVLETSAIGFIHSATLRPLAVASALRVPALPDVPTFAEAGLPLEAAAWYGVMGPAHLPPTVVRQLNAELGRILKDPAVVKRLEEIGALVAGGTPQAFESFAGAELKRYGAIVQQAGIKAD